MAKKIIPQTSIFNYKSKEFLLNLPASAIPPKSSKDYEDFILHEEEKCITGVNINGVYIPGSLYFELNHWKIKLDVLDKYGNVVKEVAHPRLRDNSWIIHNAFDNAHKQKKILIIAGGRQIQKELPDYETLITPKGKVCISDLKIGDTVYGKDGKETFVLGVYPQGVKPIYRMTLLDGRTIDCGHEHLWEVFKKNRTKKIMSTKELIDFGIKTKHTRSGFNYNFYIDEVQPVQFSKKELPIDPYILGALVGDGGCTMGTNTINTIDEEIINKFKEKLPDYEFKPESYTYKGVTQNCKHTIVYRGKKQMFNKNPLNQELIKLGLKIKSYKKFIPEVYKWSSVEDRYELIRGLFDTDGSINKKGSIEFKTSSKILAEDVMWVLRSLGIKCQLGITDVRNTKMKMPNNKSYTCNKLYYRVYVNTDKPIFNLTRKLEKLKIKKTTNRVGIESIEYIGEHSATCITVDNEDSLYLTKDFIPTHNTTTITSLLGRQMVLFPNTFSLGLYSSSKDQEVNAGYLEVGLENLEYLKIPRLDKNWKAGLIRLGYKQIDNTDEIWSTLYMRNTDEGKNTEVGAGTTLNFFVFDEIAKHPVSKAMEAVKPALISEFGRRGASVYCFTGGDVEKSKDAENLFLNPVANDVLPFMNEGKETGLFLGGWYRQDFKIKTTLSNYLNKTNPSELDEIEISYTDFDLANETLDKEQEALSKDPDKSKLLKHKMYYPRSIKEMFLSENENPFPRQALEQQLQFLKTNPYGQNIELFRSLSGKVEFKFSNKIPINEYPTKSYSLDAPIVMYDSPEKFRGQKGLHFLGIDVYNDDEAPTSDSLGSVYVFRRNHSDLSDPFNGCMVASYTTRPKTMKEFNEMCLMLAEFYDAQIMYEHTGGAFKDFLDGKNKTHLLIDTPSLQKEINPNSKVGNSKGLRPTVGNKKHALNLSLDYLNEELPDGKLGVTRILDPVLIEELLAYDGVKNTDRYIAFSMGMEAIYMYKKFLVVVNYESEEETQDRKKQYVSKKNAFGFDINKKTNIFGL